VWGSACRTLSVTPDTREMDKLTFLEHAPKKESLSIIPIPFAEGSDNTDVAHAPQYLLDAGLATKLTTAGLRSHVLPVVDSSRGVHHTLARVRDISRAEIQGGRAVVSLGGDHTVAIGSIAGASAALEGDLGVIWVDIHGDMHTPQTSLSGNIHGMATTILMGQGDPSMANLVTLPIYKEHMLYLGLRDLEQAEINLIRSKNLAVVTMPEIADEGLTPAKKKIQDLRSRVSNMWVSIDIDSIDNTVAPASAMATPGGFSHREIVNLLTYIGKTCNVVGIDLVEITPKKDIEHKTAELAIELAAAAFGAKYNWYTNYMNDYGDWYGAQAQTPERGLGFVQKEAREERKI
jgi:arginase